jgi:hypothetical protein
VPRFVEVATAPARGQDAAAGSEEVRALTLEVSLRDGLRVRAPLPAGRDDAQRLAVFVALLETR